jgi:Zn-dependent peptidase ImmA (M78 family)
MHLSTLVEIAADIRRRAMLFAPPYSTTAMIRTCFPDVVVTGRKLPPRIDEIVARTREGGVIVYKRRLPVLRQRFAIAHGIAHLLFDSDETAAAVGYAGCPISERRADTFAEELLVPLTELAKHVRRLPPVAHGRDLYLDGIDQISSRFQVPPAVILKRIRVLERQARMQR